MQVNFFKAFLFTAFILQISRPVNAQQDQTYKSVVGKTLAESKEYWMPLVTVPKAAPNVILL